MKKLVSLLLAVVMVLGMMSIASAEEAKIAMVTDYGDITDQSFNQTTWEAVVKFCTDNNIEYTYYKPDTNDTAGRVAKAEMAIDEGHNVIVMPGYAFGGTLVEIAEDYPDVKFIALDVGAGDFLENAVANMGFNYYDDPSKWTLEECVYMDNIYSAIYQEELCGYMAGYAAVKLGYTDLGFLGGMAVPAVIRYGYGFVQGCDAAAKELGINVNIKYVYGNQFFGDADITAYMDNWYQNGTQVVFACGGGIYTSAVDAAKKVDGAKVIGVDVDQSGVIANYAAGEGASEAELAKWADLTVTSAMKGLAPTTIDTLTDVVLNGNWDKYAGKIETLGLVSGDDASLNYVQIPMTTQFVDGKFTTDDYQALVKGMVDGTIVVSNDIVNAPAVTNATVDYMGHIK